MPPLRRAALALGFLALVAAAYAFIVSSSHFGGYDSYYFLLYANDLAQSASETSFARYCYFPGSYAFWRPVAMAVGRNFASYQHVFAAAGLANAALTALIVRAAGGGALVAAGTFCGYLLFGQRLEFHEMTTEPLATLASLLGILAWLVLQRRGKAWTGFLCLGAGYGLAVFMKQQGAFIAVGAVGLAPFLWGRSRSWRQGLGDAATVVTAALAVFTLAMALDGGGLAAVKMGVSTAVDYESQGHLVAHLIVLASKTPAPCAALAVAVVLWPVAFIPSRRRPGNDRTALLQVWGLGAVTAVVTLLQFTKRGYTHYALLTLPFALMAIVPAGLWVWDESKTRLDRAGEAKPPSRAAARLCFAALVLLVAVLGIDAWAWRRAPRFAGPLRHEVFASACEGIQAGQRLLLLPSRENALHWACGTHARGTRWGYTFNSQERPDEYIAELAKPELTQVFVFNATHPGSYERAVAARHDWSGFFAALATQGFQTVAQGPAGTLYRRDPDTTRVIMPR